MKLDDATKGRLIFYGLVTIVAALLIVFWFTTKTAEKKPEIESPIAGHVWQIKSVDTMKYSRDLAMAKKDDVNFESVIDVQMRNIHNMGANYVAIGTPYDSEFVPYMRKWIAAARRYELKIWFRGNFAGWEGWFGQQRNLSRDEHIAKTVEFIRNNPDIFANGDIFTPCPECENGGPGDPRFQTDVEGYREFMIAERDAVNKEFSTLGLRLFTNFNSTNFDVAQVVYDPATLAAMDNLIVVDHYVDQPADLATHASQLSKSTGAKIMLGEVGAPIANITGGMNEDEQAQWVEDALRSIAKERAIIGMNWWVNVGGETALFKDNNDPVKAKSVLEKYYKLADLSKI